MRKLVANTTFGLCLAAILLTGCARAETGTSPSSATSTSSPAPSPSGTTASPATTAPASQGIVGYWLATEADWAVQFKADGTFVEDFQGISDFRVGTYTVDGKTVTLIGGDGNKDVGTLTEDTIVFNLGTLKRK